MTTNKLQQNVPRLRFPEFEGEWEAKCIKNLNIHISDGNYGEKYPKSSEMISSGVPFIRANNFKNSRLVWDDMRYISEELNKVLVSGHTIEDDILITTRGDIGAVAYVTKEFTNSNINAQICLLRSDKETMSSKYLFQYLNSKFGEAQFIKLQTGSALKQLPKSKLLQIKVNAPSISEQQKIANLLTAVDDKVLALYKKVTALKQYKKGVMQKIFSQQVRFRDENGNLHPNWEIKRLGDISNTFSGGTPTSSNKELYAGNIPFIKSGEINKNKTEQFISEIALNTSSAKIINKGDILYALYGATSGQVAISKMKGAINQAVLCIKTTKNRDFIYQILLYKKQNILNTYLQGGQGNLSADIIKKLKIPLPSTPEQQKIANLLTTIDQKITAEESKLKIAKEWKKGLMQRMFV